jgi:hypothetical protein
MHTYTYWSRRCDHFFPATFANFSRKPIWTFLLKLLYVCMCCESKSSQIGSETPIFFLQRYWQRYFKNITSVPRPRVSNFSVTAVRERHIEHQVRPHDDAALHGKH